MRTTFSCVLCVLLVAACWAQMSPKDTKAEGLLLQAMRHLTPLINKDHDIVLHSPTNDIEECCAQSALECFKEELTSTFLRNPKTSDSKNLIEKLSRNLKKPTIMNSVNTCTKDEIKKVQCMPCNSYLKVKSKQFLLNLQFHLQKAYSRLS